MADVEVRPYRPGDLDGVLELLRLALGESPLLRRSPEWFAWKHSDNPFGPSILLVAEVAEQIAGLRAFMRWELIDPSGARLRCVRAVDTATHPGFLRRGIFRKLTESALDVARAEGVDLVFNTPNPRSGAGYLKMGWREVGHLGVMIAPRPLRMVFASRTGHPDDLTELLVGAQPAKGLEVSDRPPLGLRTPRDAAYLDWRYGANPNATYLAAAGPDGVAVLRANVRKGRTELVVSDVFGSDPRRALAQARRRSQADYLVGWFSKGTPERRAAMMAGLVPVPGLRSLRLVANPLHRLDVDVNTLAAWDVSMGDVELL